MKRSYKILILMQFLYCFVSCQEVGTADFGETATQNKSSSEFGGISVISSITDSTALIEWTHIPDAMAYEIYNTTGDIEYVTTVFAPTNNYALNELTSATNYSFIVKAKYATGELDSNTNTVTFTTNLAPDTPSGISLVTPEVSPGFIDTPTVLVSGVKNGDVIKVFTDSTCSNQVGSNTATGTTVEISTSALSIGNYNLYSTSTNTDGNSSSCSTVNLSYELVDCPVGYIKVPANTSLGVDSFCVMKYEARDNGSGSPVSVSSGLPWGDLSIALAKSKCQDLGDGFDLISNPEWMTIALNAEAVDSNWTGGEVGSGRLFRGHSDNNPVGVIGISDDTDPYTDTGNNSSQALTVGLEQRRNMILSNGEDIWDLSGNAFEWVDWTLGSDLSPGPTTCADNSWEDFPAVNCPALSNADYLPGNPAGLPSEAYDSNYYLGKFRGHSKGYARRGGTYQSQASCGIFLLGFDMTISHQSPAITFRCVFRP